MLVLTRCPDNQNVPRIISSGSSKGHLQTEALLIFNICCHRGISIDGMDP